MSLLESSYEKFCYINRMKMPDGEGAPKIVYSEGAEFSAAAVFNNSMEAKLAAVQGVTSLYTIITKKDINLEYHEIVKRIRDGKYFRITSDGDDDRTPDGAGLNMRKVSAEEFLPT